ncbi:MAG: IS630 transposase-related protein [Actinomycetota bacterium]
MGAYSKDLRLKVLAAVDRGVPRKEAVEMFGVSLATLKRWLKKRAEGKDLQPGTSTGRKRRILATAEERHALWKQLRENDEATLERHCELWEKERGVRVSIATMSRAIRKGLGWSRKKDRWVPPSETRRREVLGESA